MLFSQFCLPSKLSICFHINCAKRAMCMHKEVIITECVCSDHFGPVPPVNCERNTQFVGMFLSRGLLVTAHWLLRLLRPERWFVAIWCSSNNNVSCKNHSVFHYTVQAPNNRNSHWYHTADKLIKRLNNLCSWSSHLVILKLSDTSDSCFYSCS